MWVLELNDVNIRLFYDGELRYQHPAIALVEGKRFLFGREAMAHFRIDPAICHSQYLQKINQDRISLDRRLEITQADLLYRHLLQIRSETTLQSSDPVWVVVASDTTMDQVSLLLSILQAAEITVVDFIDSALAASSVQEVPDQAVFLDMGLHRTSASTVHYGDRFEVKSANSIVGVGLVSFVNNWINTVANRSLSESRFDPRTFGSTEQQVYEQLLTQINQESDILTLEIEHRDETRQIVINRSDLAEASEGLFHSLLDGLTNSESIVLTTLTASLPGIKNFLLSQGHNFHVCNELWSNDVVSQFPVREDFSVEERQFWRQIPEVVPEAKPLARETEVEPEVKEPSHILYGEIAYPLDASYTAFGEESSQALFSIDKQDGCWILKPEPQIKVVVDGRPVDDAVQLELGTSIRVDQYEYKLISVMHG